ncbi:hypothetical protein jhhlp_000672 [Lomentospora prolificans]|uniref:Uncharacterized protein n=1 Tax=Lomentospora prolificans TaxID=41688 RepID=A0A2N3NJ39_9PEZI|nr:hypothetical protein jhhlp_000672 [Lomentospora prolificans]
MRPSPDENLPEVVPDPSPEAIPKTAAAQYAAQLNHQNPKYPVTIDDSPKLPTPLALSPPTATASPYTETLVPGSVYPSHPSPISIEPPGKKICGVKKRTFWILILLVVVIFAAAIGGGVGGGLASRNSKASASSEPADSPNEETTSSTAATEASTTTSTSASSEPSETTGFLNETIPSGTFAFQAWSEKHYKGNVSPIYREEGLHVLGFDANSYIWLPNTTSCCVTFCDDFSVRCEEWYRPETSGPFPGIHISCDGSRRPRSCKA